MLRCSLRVIRAVWSDWGIVLLLLAVIPRLPAAPTITAVENAASNVVINAPLAQGSIFVIKGSGLGPTNISIAATPFQSTSLSGTSVTVTVGSTVVNALMYYTSATQVAALLPSNTPMGQATGGGSFVVSYNGQTSAPMSHGIVASNVGIFTIDSSGQGPAIVTYSDYSLVSAAKAASCGGPKTACGAANPGDTLIIWATGMGPVSGDDASGAGLGQNMPDVPLRLWLGGVEASIVYQGRSGCCVGEDQIVFTVPNGVPTGCAVPLVAQIDGLISNTTVMPVANGSRNCTPTNPALANAEQGVIAGPVTFADIELSKDFNSSGNGYHDNAQFTFAKVLGYNPGTQPFLVSFIDDAPSGTCITYSNLNPSPNLPFAGLTDADAGSKFNVQGPNGSVLVNGNPGMFSAVLSTSGTFLVPGAFTITGTGGTDIGAFSSQIAIPPLPTLTSPVYIPSFALTRSSGLTSVWTGGDPNATAQIQVQSASDPGLTIGSTAQCNVAAGTGAFTIPSYVLLPLPTGNLGSFSFASKNTDVPFTATSLGVGILRAVGNFTSFAGFAVK
jgi:uncharacterized protein (TIGR03437 family)